MRQPLIIFMAYEFFSFFILTVTLTDNGEKIAKKILEKRMLLKEILLSLGIDEKTAAEDACRIEHVLSDKTFEALKVYRNNL